MRKKEKALPICRQIAKKKLRENKMQSVCIIAAVILTTVLFTTAFSAVFYFRGNLQAAMVKAVGWSAHAAIQEVTDAQYEAMRQSSLVSDISSFSHLGYLNESVSDTVIEMAYFEETLFSWMGYSLSGGRMPQEENEIVLSSQFLEKLGVSAEEGAEVHLQYKVNESSYEDDFVVCGIMERDASMQDAACISKRFFEKSMERESGREKMESAFGARVAEVMFPSENHLERSLMQLLEETGATENKWILNPAYGMEMDAAIIAAAVCVLFLIMFCGYLIIYNIYYISVMQDTRFYGLLATLGFLEGEIRQVVKYKTNVLCFVSIPAGLVFGYLLSALALPKLWEPFVLGTMQAGQVRPQPLLFAFAACFSYATVRISSRKPAGMAAKMSPIAAKKYVSVKPKRKKDRDRKKISKNGYKMSVLAWKNIARERKKSMLICCSLALCIILASLFYTISRGVSMELFLEDTAVSDFIVGRKSYFNKMHSENEPLDDGLLAEMAQWDGIEASGGLHAKAMSVPLDNKAYQKYKAVIDAVGAEDYNADGAMYTWIYGLDEYIFSRMKLTAGVLDWEKFVTGDYVIVSALDESGQQESCYELGDKVTLFDAKEYTVLAIANIPYDFSARSYYAGSVDFYLPSQEWIEQQRAQAYYLYVYEVADELEPVWERNLLELAGDNSRDLSYESKETYRKLFEEFFGGFFLLGAAVSIILGAIGLLNFINVIYSGIYERRRELAIMQSMGMSRKQVYGMLVTESGYYMLISWLSGIAAGLPLGYFVVNALGKEMKFFQYRFHSLPYIAFGIAGCMLAVCVPCLIFCALDKREGMLLRLQRGMR